MVRHRWRRAGACIVGIVTAACFVDGGVRRTSLQLRRTALQADAAPEPRDGVDWDGLGFGLTTKATQMVVAKCPLGGQWSDFEVQPYGPLQLEPATTALNYGQSIFEGLKAFRTSKGRIVLFRPDKNAERMAGGAERFLMPPVPPDLFMQMCRDAVRANADWVPPTGKGSLYMRPLLFGSGPALGVGPSPEFTFVIYVAPVGSYFSGSGARLRIERGHHRAAELGVGDVKAAGNYAPCFSPQKDAKAAGFSDILYFDPSGERVEEAAASNFFCITEDGVLKTPELGTILSGVTRDSILQLARNMAASGELSGVQEGTVTWDDILSAKEAFVSGTAAAVTPVEHIGEAGQEVDLPSPGPVTSKLKETYLDIQQELRPDSEGWLVDAFS